MGVSGGEPSRAVSGALLLPVAVLLCCCSGTIDSGQRDGGGDAVCMEAACPAIEEVLSEMYYCIWINCPVPCDRDPTSEDCANCVTESCGAEHDACIATPC
jgi:hypothetical protein